VGIGFECKDMRIGVIVLEVCAGASADFEDVAGYASEEIAARPTDRTALG
jgi:hypothetical protein